MLTFHEQGERDYAALPDDLPSWKGNLNVGHGGTYGEPNGGLFAEAVANWMLWQFKGDAEAEAYFDDGAANFNGWDDAVSQNIGGSSAQSTEGSTTNGTITEENATSSKEVAQANPWQ